MYKITHTQIMAEQRIDDDNYKVDIHLELDSEEISFTKVLTVESSNEMNGYEVDEQRNKAIEDYLNSINK